MQSLPAVEQPSVAISGSSARFPVRRVYCVGRNYADHAKEMGSSGREPPFSFLSLLMHSLMWPQVQPRSGRIPQ